MIPDPSGQLAELIVYFTSTRVDLYSNQIILPAQYAVITCYHASSNRWNIMHVQNMR